MRDNIREIILEAARQLFDKNGYNGVSIKNIADSLGISTGNLTYYFKRKEDLAEAVVEMQHTAYQKSEPVESIAELRTLILHIMEVQNKNSYYFKHYAQFSQISDKIRRIQNEVFSDLRNTLSASLERLYEKGLVCDDAIPGQRKRTVDTIMLLCISQLDNEINRLDCMWNALYPILTEKGKRIFIAL